MKISQLSSHFPAQIINLHKVNQNVFDVGFFFFFFAYMLKQNRRSKVNLKSQSFRVFHKATLFKYTC